MLRIPKAIIEKDGSLLALRRADTERIFPGLWDFPGGKEESEDQGDLRRTISRETREELGQFVDVFVRKELEQKYRMETYGIDTEFSFFEVEITGEIRLSESHAEYRLLTPEELSLLDGMPYMQQFLQDHYGV